MKKKWIIVAAVAVVLGLGLTGGLLFFRGPDLSAYERFREPALLTMPSQRVLVVQATGAPAATSPRAFSALLSTYFKLDGVPKGREMPAPRARWPSSLDVPAEQWVGVFAMPVPDTVTTLPDQSGAALPASLATWEYGQVAQLLHVGPYSKETANIERLRSFITKQGLEIVGEHEEEYLRGPGFFGKGDPEQYFTLIRYRVRPASTAPSAG